MATVIPCRKFILYTKGDRDLSPNGYHFWDRVPSLGEFSMYVNRPLKQSQVKISKIYNNFVCYNTPPPKKKKQQQKDFTLGYVCDEEVNILENSDVKFQMINRRSGNLCIHHYHIWKLNARQCCKI